MNLSDLVYGFLFASGVAYYCCILMPKPTIKNKISRTTERIAMFIAGTVIVLLVILSLLKIFNAWQAWMALGSFYVMAAMLSYLGYSEWNVLWKKDLSDAAQMSMWLWDLVIAVSALAIAFATLQ